MFALLWIAITILIFLFFNHIFIHFHRTIYLQPVFWSLILLGSLLLFFKIDYKIYFESTKILNLLLGPTTVAFAIPLYEQRKKIREVIYPLSISLLVGSLTAIVSSMGLAYLFKASLLTIKTVAVKSVTSPMAIGILEKVGGDTSLIASLVILTGVFGGMFSIQFFKMVKLEDPLACGFAMGLSAHGIGTARAFQESSEMGAFASLAIGLNGVVTAILVPLIFSVF